MEMSVQLHAPTSSPSGENPSTHSIRGLGGRYSRSWCSWTTEHFISNFRYVLNVVFFLLCSSPASWVLCSDVFEHPVPSSHVVFTSPMKTEKTQCSETSAHKTQKPKKQPKERTHQQTITPVAFWTLALLRQFYWTPMFLAWVVRGTWRRDIFIKERGDHVK
jgi:hypothetical protein